MDIPLNAEVYGRDGRIGRSTYIIMNPITQVVTHMVVQDKSKHSIERLVSVKHIPASDSDMIHLDCTGEEVAQMEPFQEVEFIPTTIPHYEAMTTSGTFVWPYVTANQEHHIVKVVHLHIPPHERDIRRGAHVHASDGRIGQLDELVVDRETSHLTHLVLRKGHLWGQKDVMIPVDEIESIQENNIYLKLDKNPIAALLSFPVHR